MDSYREWLRTDYLFREMDLLVKPLAKLRELAEWLRPVREASFLSHAELARRLKVTRNAYAELERSERRGAISLASLRRAAEAMDCELVYGLRPRAGSFSLPIWEQLTLSLKDQNLFRVRRRMYDAEFRRARGWTKNSGDAHTQWSSLSEAARKLRRDPTVIHHR